MACLAAMPRCRRPLRLRAVSLLRRVHHARPGRFRARVGTCPRRRVHDPATRAGNGTQPRMAGRHSRIPSSGIAYGDLGGERLFPSCGGDRRHAVARIWRRLGTGAAACNAVWQHRRARHRTFFRKYPPTAQVPDIAKFFYPPVRLSCRVAEVHRTCFRAELSVRIIRALAGFVDSPAGVLWSLGQGVGYSPTASWKRPLPNDGKLSADDAFISGFRDGSWIQMAAAETSAEAWPLSSDKAWLVVPLSHRGEVVGFVILDRAKHPVEPDWEAFDLSRAAGRQA